MTKTKSAFLGQTRLYCEIPSYKAELQKLVKKNKDLSASEQELYNNFVHKFLAYIPVDYEPHSNIWLFEHFAKEAFEFFKKRPALKRKVNILLNQESQEVKAPAISILALNTDHAFIVDSISCLLTRLGLKAKFLLHPVITSQRNDKGNLVSIIDTPNQNEKQDKRRHFGLDPESYEILKRIQDDGDYKIHSFIPDEHKSEQGDGDSIITESLLYIHIIGTFTAEIIDNLQSQINRIFDQVEEINSNWQILHDNIKSIALSTKEKHSKISNFLEWLVDDNFTVFGLAKLNNEGGIDNFQGSNGIWHDNLKNIEDIIKLAQNEYYQDKAIIFGKIHSFPPIHSTHLIDYILLKEPDSADGLSPKYIILGIYNATINYQSIKKIPLLNDKLELVLSRTQFPICGYNSKKLKLIIESLPTELLLQINEDDLYCMSLHMLSSMVSKSVKVFIQEDYSRLLIDTIIFLPRKHLTPEVHTAINHYLSDKFSANILSDYITEVAEDFSYLFITLYAKEIVDYEYEQIERDISAIAIEWYDQLYQELGKKYGEYLAAIEFKALEKTFPIEYQQRFTIQNAITDLEFLAQASKHNNIFCNLKLENDNNFTLKLYSAETPVALSDMLPAIENLGFKALDERSFLLQQAKNFKNGWIYEFTLVNISNYQLTSENFKAIKSKLEKGLQKIFSGELANDSLSKLILLAQLNWQQVKVLKALTRYLHQTSFTYGKGYVQLVLIKHYEYTKLLISFIAAKFDPHLYNTSNSRAEAVKILTADINRYFDTVVSGSEDKVLRSMFNIAEAMVRTNCYQLTDYGRMKDYLSFKFVSHQILHLPKPLPYREIFVYSNDFEGVHLRGGKIARGGIRWSDRGEDYRTEVLGLMKAQMTKNTLIVAVGAKGGFFVTAQSENFDNDYMQHVVKCYKSFLKGLLDITDNIIDGQVVNPQNAIIYDENDSYLVVAADKGTATFSDYANEVSNSYNFWLADAFASGGSAGYDHKKIGITAKGAWISVKSHFQTLGINVQTDPIKVVGIGDMSGDVFGNGMLLSSAIKLVGAFNHRHIFIDPDPDPQVSFKERKRLFELPRSSWTDYNQQLISKGGGIFERSSKIIKLSDEAKIFLGLQVDKITPDDLIKALLCAKVDLIWNGGIGTYIKASTENHLDIGDRANDNLRCNATEIKAKVIAEGGNLGVSQLGRIEYSKHGGIINTDFIDNSAGVDCSDHEVNIKIALNKAYTDGKITLEERNNLLDKMTNEVEQLVLMDNYSQNEALLIASTAPFLTTTMFERLIAVLEEKQLLDRGVEFLPNQSELNRRLSAKEGFTRPELSVLLSYSKMFVFKELTAAKLAQDTYFEQALIEYFPHTIRSKFLNEILSHPLKEEIIKTILTNKIINRLTGPIILTIQSQTDRPVCDIVRAYIVISAIFDLDSLWQKVSNTDTYVDPNTRMSLFTELNKIMRRGVVWLLKHRTQPLHITDTIAEFRDRTANLRVIITDLLSGEAKLKFMSKLESYIAANLEPELAKDIAALDSMISIFDVIHIAQKTHHTDLHDLADLYFSIASVLELDWLRKKCDSLMDESYWNRLAIQSLKDDIYDKHRKLLVQIITQSHKPDLEKWLAKHYTIITPFLEFIAQLKELQEINLNIVILANKKLEMVIRKLQ